MSRFVRSIDLPDVTNNVPQIVTILVLLAAGGALAVLPLMLKFGAVLAAIVVISSLWLDMGYAIYITALHFILFVKRIAMGLPVGIALDAFAGLLLLSLLIRLSRPDNAERSRWRHPMVAVILGYEAYLAVDAFNPGSLSLLFSTYAVRQTLPNFIVFMLTVYVLSTRLKLQRFMLLWYGIMTVVALYAIKQQFFGFYWREYVWMYSPEGQVWTTAEGVIRVFSTMLPDTLGITMAYGMTFSLALLFAPLRFYWKVLLVALMPLFGAAMLYTGTRGAYGAAIAGLLVVVLLLRRWWLYLIVPVAASLAALSIDWNSNYWGLRFLSLFNPGQDSSYQVRESIISRHLDSAMNSIFGTGTGTTSYAGFAQEQFDQARQSGAFLATTVDIPTDNNYFLALIENGVVGELLLLVVIGVVLWYAVRTALTARDRYLRCLAIGLCGCCCAATVASIANNYLGFWGTWIVFGLICTTSQLAQATNEEEVDVDFIPVEDTDLTPPRSRAATLP